MWTQMCVFFNCLNPVCCYSCKGRSVQMSMVFKIFPTAVSWMTYWKVWYQKWYHYYIIFISSTKCFRCSSRTSVTCAQMVLDEGISPSLSKRKMFWSSWLLITSIDYCTVSNASEWNKTHTHLITINNQCNNSINKCFIWVRLLFTRCHRLCHMFPSLLLKICTCTLFIYFFKFIVHGGLCPKVHICLTVLGHLRPPNTNQHESNLSSFPTTSSTALHFNPWIPCCMADLLQALNVVHVL